MTDDAKRAVLDQALENLEQQRYVKATELRMVESQIREIHAAMSEIGAPDG